MPSRLLLVLMAIVVDRDEALNVILIKTAVEVAFASEK